MTDLTQKWQAVKLITRMDKPIGTYLLLWPTFWALLVAADGFPGWHLTLVFAAGVFIMRSAGCVINDFADRNVDGHVKRTAQRPLVSGLITEKQAIALFIGLLLIALMLVLTLSWQTIQLSFVALLLAASYPYMKRFTHLPQVVLGAAFSWGMIMAFSEINGSVPIVAWLLFFANLFWTVAYDTMYAMVDRDDDKKIGVKSTAILFGRFDKMAIAFLQLLTLTLLFKVGQLQQFNAFYYLALIYVTLSFAYQHHLIQRRERDNCFKAFLNNHYGLLVVLFGIICQFVF
ncbi:4-hydroxybenzoate octaprenyltransferase [Thalassotalea sp. Y01]|uniref:4-hydroxybenzoate octaprenyltransferase n=1 Tax=Thalassotalea sp. Y01 TaxID=2729613 RepID=UPI00145CA7C0|nr:4-hydroxybenzoate octaprenyltransferase [Thalassotalea sp. Y01]NMP16038.1 4-hydroxybenzoate octaprenyltransferase [Thalassotalea sp. Y01]